MMFEETKVRERMHQAGAESYALKSESAPSEELLAAIRGREPASQEPGHFNSTDQ
jgi:hypothetical protein